MAISEQQLEAWSHQGSKVQSANTYNTIKQALNDTDSPYYKWYYSIFLQGSYGNDTNIYADSDVDIVMCLNSVYYDDTTDLSEDEQRRYKANWTSGGITLETFKGQVLAWLKSTFGPGVRAGNKAIFVPGNGSRRDADVLVCADHRDYVSFPAQGQPRYHEGICFWTSKGEKIVNYPRQHMENCTDKHGTTSHMFKRNIRVFKNMRNAMIDHGFIADGVAPSYFIEGMLYSVPDQLFASAHQRTIQNTLDWLGRCNVPDLLCASERYYLVREGSSVCWNSKDFRTTLIAMHRYWNSGHR